MNDKVIKIISVILGIFLSSSLLSGAGVGFSTWYPAPRGISVLLVSISCGIVLVRLIYLIIKFSLGKPQKGS